MLDGKMFFGLTGMPMRNRVLAKMPLALAEPDPFTVANFTTKSLMPLILRDYLVQRRRLGQAKRSPNTDCWRSLRVGSSLTLDPTYVNADRHCDGSSKPATPAPPHT